jgi:conjugative relaxase-like TrwC/TraI family protein
MSWGVDVLRIKKLKSSKAAKAYYQHSDYYLEVAGEWLGEGAKRHGLEGKAEKADFEAVCDNIDPKTGGDLTARTVKGRRVGWDFNFNASKSVSVAREIIGLHDPAEGQRIEDAHREAVAYVAAMMEKDIACRVREGGKDEDYVTGNGIFMRVTHRTTRPNEDDLTPDPDIHDHLFLANATHDAREGKTKAIQNERIYQRAPYYEAVYHNRLAENLKELGYGVVRKGKGFEIAGMTRELIDKFSRRSKTIDKKAKELGITSDEAKDKLGATTRLGKCEAVTEDLPGYWDGKLTDDERGLILGLKGHNSGAYESTVEKSVAYAIEHEFFRNSVIDPWRLYETAIRHGIGSVTPEEVEAEAKRQGVIFAGGKASTRDVLDQEQRIIAFARSGKGTCRPLAPERHDGLAGLSEEQSAAVQHIWQSKDRVMLIRGGAGTGKTTMMTPALAKLGVPAVLLAPSAEASRGELRRSGFEDANTVAAFLSQENMQEKARGGLIWVDEASLLAIDDLDKLCGLAKSLGARIVLQGDPKQHKAVQRHGNMLTVLEEYAGLKVAKLTKIQRQKGEYAKVNEAIRDGKWTKAVELLDKLGCLVEGEGHDALVAEYAGLIGQRKANGEEINVLVIDPTHKDGDALSEKLRAVRREKGLIVGEERTFLQLTALGWTPAQQGDAAQYAGDEVIQFFRNSGKFKAGRLYDAVGLLPHLAAVNPECFAVYRAGEVRLAVGDKIRVTANGRDVTGDHRLDNGRIDTIKRFTKDGGIMLSNGWVMGRDFAHVTHGLVRTSVGTQSKGEDVVLAAMNKASLGAIGAEQALVTISRGKERGMVFTDMTRQEFLAAVARADNRMSATQLFYKKPKAAPLAKSAERAWEFMEKVRCTYRQIQRKAANVARNRDSLRQRETGYER